MPDFVQDLPGLAQGIAAVVTSALVVWGAWIGVYRPLRKHFERVNRGMDTLLGYPPVLDPGSDREIQPATPPLASRVWDLEQTHVQMVEALKTLADNQQRLLDLREELDERRKTGDLFLEDFAKWRANVESRFKKWATEQDAMGALIREQITPPQDQEK